jgi:hypothetical protein
MSFDWFQKHYLHVLDVITNKRKSSNSFLCVLIARFVFFQFYDVAELVII